MLTLDKACKKYSNPNPHLPFYKIYLTNYVLFANIVDVVTRKETKNMNKHIIYLKQGKVCKYRTAKSYIKYKSKCLISAQFNRLSAFIERETAKPLNITTNA